MIRRKVTEKWLGVAKPVCSAMSVAKAAGILGVMRLGPTVLHLIVGDRAGEWAAAMGSR